MDSGQRKKLKTWQHEFRTKHKREPRRSDIAQVPDIAAIYDAWTAAAGKGKAKAARSSTSSNAEAGPSRSSSNQQPMGRPPPPSTPTKMRSVLTDPRTPVHGSRGSPSRNPFQTPTKTPSRPLTPSSAVKLRTPPANQSDIHQGSHDAHFHYNTSPSSFRALVGAHSLSQSPNRRGKDTSSVDALLASKQALTPRTKARKRLRGEEVPPTPHSKGGSRKDGVPSPARTSLPPRKRRAQGTTASAGGVISHESKDHSSYWSDAVTQPKGSGGGSMSLTSRPFRRNDSSQSSTTVLPASPSARRMTSFDRFQRKADQEETYQSANMTGRRFESIFDAKEPSAAPGSPEREPQPDSQADSGSGAGSMDVDEDEHVSQEYEPILQLPTASGVQRLPHRPLQRPVQQAQLDFSSDEDRDEAVHKAPTESPSKTIYLRAYQRFGELNLQGSGGTSGGEFLEDDNDDLDDRLPGTCSPRKMKLSAAQPNSGDDNDGQTPHTGSSLEEAPSALRTLRQHQEHSHRLALTELLGGSSRSQTTSGNVSAAAAMAEEMERELAEEAARQRADAAVTSSEQRGGRRGHNADAKTWGQAKAEAKRKAKGGEGFLLGKARRGFGASLGTDVLSDDENEEQDITTENTAATSRPSKVFHRQGRSGVEDDEQRRDAFDASSGDDDWASEADSDEWWGVGDGAMDPTDVC